MMDTPAKKRTLHLFRRQLIGAIIIVLSFASELQAQQFPNYSFRYFDVKSGLKGNEVYAMSQEKSGMVWIGTNNGLYRFDGVNFYSFAGAGNRAPLLGHYRGLLAHSDGSMWVCTDYSGASRFDPKTALFTHYQPNGKKGSIADGASYLMREDEHKNIWFAHFFKGISRYNYKTQTFDHWKHEPGNKNSLLSNNIYALCPDMKGGLWIGYQNEGISYLNIATGSFTHYTAQSNCGLKKNNVFALVFDQLGTLWVSAGNELYSFSQKNSLFTRYTNPTLFDNTYYLNGYFNAKQKLIYFTSTRGLYALNPVSKEIHLYELVNNDHKNDGKNRCTNILFDRNNNLWAQFNQGFCLATEINNPLIPYKNLIDISGSKKISYFEAIKNETAYGIFNNTLYIKNLNTQQTSLHTLPDQFATEPLKEEEAIIHNASAYSDKLLINIKSHYYLFDTRSKTFLKIPPVKENEPVIQLHVYQSTIDRKGNIWILDEKNGLLKFDFAQKKWSNVNPGNQKVTSDFFYYRTTFREDKNGNVWCANPYFGIIEYLGGDPKKFVIFKYGNNPSVSPLNQIIMAICEAPDGNIYFAGKSGVLDCYIPSKKRFIHYKRTACFEDNPANLVIDQDGYLWGFNNQSIYRMKPKNPGNEEIKKGIIDEFEYYSYDWKNGFEGDYFGNNFVYVTQNNRLYFDAKESHYYINPRLWNNSSLEAPGIFFTNMFINGKSISETDISDNSNPAYWGIPSNIRLLHDENNLEFDFASNSLVNAQNNLFKYKLMPHDREWRYTNAFSPKAVYHNLQPGEYTFVAYGSGSDGVWSKEPVKMSITIKPGFIQSIWFKIMIGAIVLLLFFTFYRIRINQIIRLQEERNKISRDLHDNIGSTISSAGFSSKLLKDNMEKPETREKLVNKIQGDIKLLGESIDDIIWSINPKNDNRDELFAKMRRYGSDLLDNSNIEYSFNFSDTEAEQKIKAQVRKELFMIYKEALNNIIKHSGAGKVSITVTVSGTKNIIMEITDNGKGFDTGLLTHRNGLKNMRTRAESIQADFTVESIKGKGTTIKLAT